MRNLSRSSAVRTAVAKAKREAENAYRRAIALQSAGMDASDAWAEFAKHLSIVLSGSSAAREWKWLNTVGYPMDDAARVREGVREVLRQAAAGNPNGPFLAEARRIAGHEGSVALVEMEKRSPEFAYLRRGMIPETDIPMRVAGTTPAQARGLAELVADSMLERPSLSVVGKRLNGLGVGDFVTKAQVELGVRLTDARLETVMRTTIATAETEAENRIMEQPTVRLMAPLMQWSATMDNRTRPTHRAMNGYANTVEAYRILRLGPPLGFNCRCVRIPMPLARTYALGLTDARGVPDNGAIREWNGARNGLIESGAVPDPGFDAP